MAQYNKQISFTAQREGPISVVTQVPQKESGGPQLTDKPVSVDLSPQTAQEIFDSMVSVKCSIAIEYPSPAIGENLLVKYTEHVQRIKDDAQKQYDTWETIFEWSEIVWQAGYIVVSFVGGGALGAQVWGLLHSVSTKGYGVYLDQLQQDIADGVADQRVVEKIAVISGAVDEYSGIRQVVDQMPSNELTSRLTELRKIRKTVVSTMGPNSVASLTVFRSTSYQVGYYYALTIIDLNIKAICDRMRGIDPSVPQAVLTDVTLPPPTDAGIVLPPTSVLDRFENPPKSKLPLLMSVLAAAAFLL